MMGSKERHFAPLITVSLEELVPADHFYRHLERTLDLSFVRQFVQETYASKGRPSVDPVVFFKLQLVMFFEGIRSDCLEIGCPPSASLPNNWSFPGSLSVKLSVSSKAKATSKVRAERVAVQSYWLSIIHRLVCENSCANNLSDS